VPSSGWRGKGTAGRTCAAAVLDRELVVFGVLLYAAFWLPCWLAFALIAAWLLRQRRNLGIEEKQPELRDGHSGAGVTTRTTGRIDLGDPDDP